MEDIIETIKKRLPPGTVIPKPESVSEFRIKDWKGEGDDEELAYIIPSHADPPRPSSKRIPSRRIRASFARLMSTGELTHVWFTTTAKNGKVEGGCNFTTVGGIFCFLGFAEHAGRGRYRKVVPQGTK